jgi:hypothetical protein
MADVKQFYKPKSKYKAIPTIIDGIRFASKRESQFYTALKLLKEKELISYFLMQVPIILPGAIKYIVDFQVFYSDGNVRYIDAKGMKTPMYNLKKKQVEALYPIIIEEAL